jgi:uncharacterized membrane protein
MTFRWETLLMSDRVFAAARVDAGFIYYVGLAVVVVILVGALIAFYRTWTEIHEDEEPDSPQDLLKSFREAHAAGQIDDGELERVRDLLSGGDGQAAAARTQSRPSGPADAGERTAREDAPDAAQPRGTEPGSI